MSRRYRRLLVTLVTLAATAVALGGAASSASAESCAQKIFDGGGYIFDSYASASIPPEVGDYYGDLEEGGSNGPEGTPPGPVETDDAYDYWGGLYLFSPGTSVETPTVENKYLG